MNISISICPTEMEFASGDFYDEHKLLAAIREFVEQRHPARRSPACKSATGRVTAGGGSTATRKPARP